jgi:hypothetical protein
VHERATEVVVVGDVDIKSPSIVAAVRGMLVDNVRTVLNAHGHVGQNGTAGADRLDSHAVMVDRTVGRLPTHMPSIAAFRAVRLGCR